MKSVGIGTNCDNFPPSLCQNDLDTLREVNALKISASDTDIGGISAIGTDLVGTSFQCHSHGTVFQ